MAPRLILFFSLFSTTLLAQFASPISWTFEARHLERDRFELVAIAKADPGWSIYSQYTDDGGPVPTTFYWEEGDHYEKVGQTEEEGHRKEGVDDLFGVNVIKFLSDEPTVFTQTVRILDYARPITGEVEYMCCDDTQCLPPTTEPFNFSLTAPATKVETGDGAQEKTPSPAPEPEIVSEATTPATATPQTDQEANMPAEEIIASHRVSLPPPSEDEPVSWALLVEEMGGDRYRLSLTGTMAESWTVYSKDVDPTIGPIPTEWAITGTDGVEALGTVTETADHLKKKYDTTWEAEVAKIDGGTVTYSQVVRAPDSQPIEGYLTFQTCNDEMCLPPRDIPFSFDPATGETVIDGIREDGNTDAAVATTTSGSGDDYAINAEPIAACNVGEAATRGQSLWSIFGLGLLGGFFALIMPCIFPMIPLTVSFFTKSGGSRAEGIKRAALYGFFIFLIYVLLSVPFHLIAGIDPGILNNIASNIWLNMIFFVVFVVFAGSFFGFYELTLPQSWSNRASQAEGVGGTVGIFFMALTLALVSFSCTGPILGSLLVEAVSDGAWPLTAGMAGFGVALGLPFALFAAFPGVLNNMPKSGGWLNSVKVVLGFVELALAFKFLSNADLVGDWNLLRIEPFLIIWILCALGIAAYLLRLISFPHDSSKRKIGPVAGIVAAASVLFAVYLAFGFTKNEDSGSYESLNLLSGIAPPVCYSYLNPCDCPQGITCFKDLDAGLAYAKEVNKPVMLDFTGYTCVNCRKMEENVWSQDRINNLLTEDYVLISLYVDDRKELPAEQQREVTRLDGSGRNFLIDQVGEKWHYFQQSVFQHATQPYYVLVSPDGQTLNPPVAYTPDEEKYEAFLRCGLEAFQGLK
ncbi:protein-disulfide reductase DsbD family protein [Lewinella sp. IMCC34191]|uniref:protein-disulfide reductase DsbD family protein n=1 Tax=Lewinella sp. IMCC34191 TaxID=2259172 RepID=UPI000E24A84A|nr:cytochrome c biogenesis protein CcdA [Lewinella sp. IMCC34191]